MSYSGSTYLIPFNRGGLFDDPSLEGAPTDMVSPTRNLNLHQNGREKRGGTAHVDAAAMPDTPQVMGLYDFGLINGNRFVIRALKDGKIYKDYTTSIKTGMSTVNHFSFETFENEVFICDGVSVPQTWDGVAATTSNITSSPTDWGSGNNPQQFIKHGYGNSERLWALGCPGTPHNIYASANGDGKDFGDTNVIKLRIETGDGFGIVGGVEYGDRLIAFGKQRAFIILDSDVDTANWGYKDVQWQGGAAHWRLLIKTPYDIIAMMEDGEIYSVIAAENYGDYKAASLTRPAFIHRWIKDNVNLAYIAGFHGVYDPVLRAVKIFVVRNGQTQCDTALVYFIDRPVREAWMIHGNESAVSGYSASCSALVRESTGNYKIYTGDYSGWVWKLETANRNDNGAGYYAGFKTPALSMDNPRGEKMFRRGWLTIQPKGDYPVRLIWWMDGVSQGAQDISLAGAGAVLGSFLLGTDYLAGAEIIDVPFDLGNKGRRIEFEIYNNIADQDFYLSKMMIDHKPVGARPGK